MHTFQNKCRNKRLTRKCKVARYYGSDSSSSSDSLSLDSEDSSSSSDQFPLVRTRKVPPICATQQEEELPTEFLQNINREEAGPSRSAVGEVIEWCGVEYVAACVHDPRFDGNVKELLVNREMIPYSANVEHHDGGAVLKMLEVQKILGDRSDALHDPLVKSDEFSSFYFFLIVCI